MGFPLWTLDHSNEPSNVRTFVYSLFHMHLDLVLPPFWMHCRVNVATPIIVSTHSCMFKVLVAKQQSRVQFKLVTSVMHSVPVNGGIEGKLNVQCHFPLQVWVRLWYDLAGWCWLYWEWIMPRLLLKQGDWVSQLSPLWRCGYLLFWYSFL